MQFVNCRWRISTDSFTDLAGYQPQMISRMFAYIDASQATEVAASSAAAAKHKRSNWICMKTVWLDIVWYAFYWFPSKRVCFRLLAIRLRAQKNNNITRRNSKRCQPRHERIHSLQHLLFDVCVCVCFFVVYHVPFLLRMFLENTLHLDLLLTSHSFFSFWCVHVHLYVLLLLLWVRFNVSTLVKLCVVVIHLIFLPLLFSRTDGCIRLRVFRLLFCFFFFFFSFKDVPALNDTPKFCPTH